MNDAGVHIEWRSSVKQCENTQGSIFIDISNRTSEANHSGAFAYALPYEGTRIVLFYDRVLEITWPGRVPGVLGHVLAHEITHVLQGVARHSGVGVMKAKWDYLDHGEMQHNYLKLTGEDICLIRTGKFEVALR